MQASSPIPIGAFALHAAAFFYLTLILEKSVHAAENVADLPNLWDGR
jgi:hypothetical protein